MMKTVLSGLKRGVALSLVMTVWWCALPLVAHATAEALEITGLVWLDINGDGLPDKGEAGISTIYVNLLDPLGINSSQQTGSDGTYLFDHLHDLGTYQVSVNPLGPGLAGLTPTTATSFMADFTGTPGTVFTFNFGFQRQQAPIPEPSTILLLGSGLVGLAAWRYQKTVKA